MENKGLNIFNSIYVLAKPQTATDSDFHGVQGVVGHEYFHNWTGNRVTCRDWFQLSLKEGLTVFRDQEFSADMTSRAVRRIEEVSKLRTEQFAEDAGPMAHPIRPSSYIEINNFYTRTIYEKGAEVIRMIHTIIGEKNFRKGMDKYFELFDGQAVRTEDFVAAMEQASGADLTQFKHWYDQAGTPLVRAQTRYDERARVFELTLEQSCPPTPGQPEKKPFHIPVSVGLIDANGRDLPLLLDGEDEAEGEADGLGAFGHAAPEPAADGSVTRVLHLRQPRQTFKFKNISAPPVVSLLRGFSAPVRLEYACDSSHLSFQLANDKDPFCRWEAGQKLVIRTVQALVSEMNEGRGDGFERPRSEATRQLLTELVHSFGIVIKDQTLDPALKALLLDPPSEPYLAQFFDTVYPAAIHKARETVILMIAGTHETALLELHQFLAKSKSNVIDAVAAGQRALRNICLSLLTRASERHLPLALNEFRAAQNMTEELGAMAALNRHDSNERRQALQEFHDKWKNETLVINKWLHLQAISPLPNTLERIQHLSKDPVFDETNPNKVANLYGRFGSQNSLRFHDPSGAAYTFIADRILEIDGRNPQLAARVVSVFNSWKRYEPALRERMKTELERILGKPNLSKNVFEIVSKALL
jgi:aminopeptidase N